MYGRGPGILVTDKSECTKDTCLVTNIRFLGVVSDNFEGFTCNILSHLYFEAFLLMQETLLPAVCINVGNNKTDLILVHICSMVI